MVAYLVYLQNLPILRIVRHKHGMASLLYHSWSIKIDSVGENRDGSTEQGSPDHIGRVVKIVAHP